MILPTLVQVVPLVVADEIVVGVIYVVALVKVVPLLVAYDVAVAVADFFAVV